MTKPFDVVAGALAIFLFAAGSAFAAGGGSSDDTNSYDDTPAGSALKSGMDAVNDEDWPMAIQEFTIATQEDPDNADAFNMLAYSYRQSGDLDNAFANYDKALALDPDHKDALEYLGEAYLAAGDLAKAEEQLAKLDDICWLGCEAYDELEEAISIYKASN